MHDDELWAHIDGLPFTIAHDNFDGCDMHVLSAPTCNYYERGTTSSALYDAIKLQETTYAMHWPLLLKEICPRGNNKVIIYFLISW